MSDIVRWCHRWYGVWAEFGLPYQKCPSIFLFVDPEVNKAYQKDRLRAYLTSAPVVASTSRLNFPNPFTGECLKGSISFRTDGKWLWLDDLADYVDRNGVVLPENWLFEIEARGYLPPEMVPDSVIAQLEWPPIT